MRTLRVAAFGLGYPLALVVIARFVPVVRHRRWRWLVAHHLGVSAIIAGWAARGEPAGVAVNAAWLAASSAWYALGGPRRGTPSSGLGTFRSAQRARTSPESAVGRAGDGAAPQA